MFDGGALRIRSEDAPDDAAGLRRFGDHLSPAQLAQYWGVHLNTIYRDIRKGALRALRLPSGQLRIRTVDARRYGKPVD